MSNGLIFDGRAWRYGIIQLMPSEWKRWVGEGKVAYDFGEACFYDKESQCVVYDALNEHAPDELDA